MNSGLYMGNEKSGGKHIFNSVLHAWITTVLYVIP